jgi:hypothetical protein
LDTYTTNHKEIREWAKAQGGKPGMITHRDGQQDRVGIRINFPGKADERLLGSQQVIEEVGWEEFFRVFEAQDLIFVYASSNKQKDPSDRYRFEKGRKQH